MEGGPKFDEGDLRETLSNKSADDTERYPRYERGEDGKLSKVGREGRRKEANNQGRSNRSHKREEEKIDHGRRGFLKKAGLFGAGVVASGSMPWWLKDALKEDASDMSENENVPEEDQEAKEKIPTSLLPHEELASTGKIESLASGINAKYQEHFEYLMESNDMEQAVQNMEGIDMDRFAEPFPKRELPSWLSYAIAIQETRGKVVESWAGAVGITGIMEYTAKRFGYTARDVKDPYIASEVTARYLAVEREERFGNENIPMLLHAYNGGGGLAGFTGSVSREERTPETFYTYMNEKINKEAKEKLEAGYHAYIFEDRCENLTDVANLFDVSLEALQRANSQIDSRDMQYGDRIKIPLEGASPQTWRELFRKYFEVLYYAPEVYAKMAVLHEKGLVRDVMS